MKYLLNASQVNWIPYVFSRSCSTVFVVLYYYKLHDMLYILYNFMLISFNFIIIFKFYK